jgi:hypothetical protein
MDSRKKAQKTQKKMQFIEAYFKSQGFSGLRLFVAG